MAKTCKILYEQEFLDNQKLFKQGYSHNKILYENMKEYECLCNEFKNKLPILIKDNNIDDWLRMDGKFRLSGSSDIEYILNTSLTTLSKNQNKLWVNHMTDILSCAVRGLATSINYMNKFNEYANCEECSNDEIDVNFQDKFKERGICNIMIINVINSILFDDNATNGGCHYGNTGGEMDKIIQFKCKKCNKFCDMLDRWDNELNDGICYDCN